MESNQIKNKKEKKQDQKAKMNKKKYEPKKMLCFALSLPSFAFAFTSLLLYCLFN